MVFQAMTIVGSWDSSYLPPWPLDSLALWAGLVQDCLLPLVLLLSDANFGPWVKKIYQRPSAHQMKVPPPLYPGLLSDLKPGPGRYLSPDPVDSRLSLSNGSLFPGGSGPILNNYQHGRGKLIFSKFIFRTEIKHIGYFYRCGYSTPRSNNIC
jgi:hypothetical protein